MRIINKLCTFALACLFAGSCASEIDAIHTGDLLFIGIPMTYDIEEGMAGAIVDATGGEDINYIHTAILDVDEDGLIWAIDATIKYGVDRHPLDTLIAQFELKNGLQPHYEVMRLRDDSHVREYVSNSLAFLGEDYDQWFLPDNGRHYCTELVYDSYRDAGVPRFTARPMNFKNSDGEFPVYWQQLFDMLGEPIPQDVPGTNPQEMHADPSLVLVKSF